MVPPKNAFLSLRLPIFGSSYYQCFYTFGIAPRLVLLEHAIPAPTSRDQIIRSESEGPQTSSYEYWQIQSLQILLY